MPWGVPLVALLLAFRAMWDLRTAAPAESAMRIGIREMVTGLVAAGVIGGTWRGFDVRSSKFKVQSSKVQEFKV